MADERPVDGRDSHPVAVVADPCHDPFQDPSGVQDAARQRVAGSVGRGDAEDVGVADRLGARGRCPSGSRITPPRPGVGPPVGVDRRRVVVGLDLETDVKIVVEPDHARVVGEDADEPVAAHLLGRAEDGPLEEVVDHPAVEIDPAPEGLVRTMLGPGLREGLEFAVGRLPSEFVEMGLDGLELGEAEVQLPLPADVEELGVGLATNRHLDAQELVGSPLAELVEREGADDGLLDRFIKQDPADQALEAGRWPINPVGPDGPDVLNVEPEVGEERPGALGLGVGDARLGEDVDDGPSAREGREFARPVDLERLDGGVDEDRLGGADDLGPADRPFDQEASGGRDGPRTREPEFPGVGDDPSSRQVDLPPVWGRFGDARA